MPEPLVAGMPPGLILTGDYILRLDAISPASGADITGVIVSDVSIQSADFGPALTEGPYMLVPGPTS